MNTISTKLEAQYKDVAAKADALFKRGVEFVQDPDVRSCFGLAANHGFNLEKLPDMAPCLVALQQALQALKTTEDNEDKEKAREIKESADPVVIDVVAEEVPVGAEKQ